MAYRPRGHARVDPEAPRAFAICDRCGSLYNRDKLRWQFQYRGTQLSNIRLLVCEECTDKPSAFLRAFSVPADPPALRNIRAEPYAIDEATDWDLTGPLGNPGPVRFTDTSAFRAVLTQA